MIDLLHALLLGIIEGITEFLPISSTGHLIVSQRLLGFKDHHDLFAVVIQVGAIAAVIWYYRQDLWQKTIGLFRGNAAALNFWKILVIGTLPAAVIGLLFDKASQAITNPTVVALALILGGIVLWLVDSKPVSKTAVEVELDQISPKQAVLIGLGQCVAMIPGVSRSGATIVSGLAVKLNRSTATAFSFYLSIPVLVMASLYKLAKYHAEIPVISGGYAGIIVGLFAAFITALFAVSWLLRYIAGHNFKPFAVYRIVVGIVILLLLGVGWL
ncbi:MAG TPA: undecaprenyl-diphosphate phosphatase [Candidatus Saccharibacteria bacterium]|nr:undecaprenyl-diphosphate phosphatase [Candidatus Saccharibacteria bacterium]